MYSLFNSAARASTSAGVIACASANVTFFATFAFDRFVSFDRGRFGAAARTSWTRLPDRSVRVLVCVAMFSVLCVNESAVPLAPRF
jgi:hypothetical protein